MIKAITHFYFIAVFLYLAASSLSAQTTSIRDFDQPGTITYTVPNGVTELVIECWGGGGGGSAAIGLLQGINSGPGAGGGGGAHAHSVVKVTSGQTFTITIGVGGAGGTSPYTLGEGNGKNGQSTTFSDASGALVIADGGKGASFVRLSEGESKGGSGGQYINSKGTVIHTGGWGADAGTNYSGGGGGTGGRTHEGYNAVGMTAGNHGSCYCGIPGAGGMGLNTSGDGNPGINTENTQRGVIYAGGGGGGGYDSEYAARNGGKGANGHVRIKEQLVMGDITGTPYTEIGKTTQLIPPISGGEWRSSLVNIATIDETGLVTGVSSGETIISYSVGGWITGQSTEIHVIVYPEGKSISIAGIRSYCESGVNHINLEASAGITDDVIWFWTGPNNFTWGGSGFTREAITANAGKYVVTASKFAEGNAGDNLIVNGDFSNGNTGFNSDYIYSQFNQNGGGIYNVDTKPKNWAFSASCGDHTSGTGNYMSLMGNSTNNTVWSQHISNIAANTDYNFSYWMQAMEASSQTTPANIKMQARINGQNIGAVLSKTTAKECNGWIQFVYNWNSGDSTSADIELNLAESMSSGFQVGLDDIIFRQIDTDAYSVLTADVYIEVAAQFTPTIQIFSTPSVPIEGQKNIFVASAEYAGIEPQYNWYVNEELVQSDSKAVFTSTTLVKDDIIMCELIPDQLDCVTDGPYYSATLKVLEEKNYWYGLISTKWYVVDNWTSTKLPEDGEDIEFATLENCNFEVQNDLEINGNIIAGNYINATDKKIIIPAGNSLTINGQIETNTNNRILIQASETESNGSLIFPNANAPLATVEMWSKSKITPDVESNNKIKWQYFGIPVQSLTASPTFNGAYVRSYNESKQTSAPGLQWEQLVNTSAMYPFLGYEIAQQNPQKYSISGQLIKDDFQKELTVTSGSYYAGQHIMSNPYTGAIQISKIDFGAGLEQTVYLFNTGSYAEWTSGVTDSPQAGSFMAIPKQQAESMDLNEIPSMQGFLIRVLDKTEDCTLNLSYNNMVKPNTKPLKSSKNKAYIATSIKSNHYFDKAWIFKEDNCTSDYDNGWDGYKIFTSQTSAYLYIIEDNKSYEVSSTNDLNNIYLAFKKGNEDTEYTLYIESEGLREQYDSLLLTDLETNKTIDILAGNTEYTFTAIMSQETSKRFKITSKQKKLFPEDKETKTDKIYVFARQGVLYIDNRQSDNGQLTIYDLSGRVILQNIPFTGNAVTILPTTLTSGIYIGRLTCGDKKQTVKILF